MANPQLENGHSKIANELIEALSRVNLSPYESRVLWYIIRKTYGWNKKFDKIAQSQISESTGLRKQHTSRAMKSLKSRKIIIDYNKKVTSRGDKQIGINKDYEQWSPVEVTFKATHDEKVTSRGDLLRESADGKVTSTGDKKSPVLVTKSNQQRHHKSNKSNKEDSSSQNRYLLPEEKTTTNYYVEKFGGELTPGHASSIIELEREFSKEEVKLAIDKAVKQGKTSASYNYLRACILNNGDYHTSKNNNLSLDTTFDPDDESWMTEE